MNSPHVRIAAGGDDEREHFAESDATLLWAGKQQIGAIFPAGGTSAPRRETRTAIL
jgi:hypothetical protein